LKGRRAILGLREFCSSPNKIHSRPVELPKILMRKLTRAQPSWGKIVTSRLGKKEINILNKIKFASFYPNFFLPWVKSWV